MSDKKRLVKSVLIGSLCGVLATVILMCILAAAMLSAGLFPAGLTEWLTLGFAAVGAFAGGFIAAKLNRGAGLIVGAITGAVMFLLITIAALSRGGTNVSTLTAVRMAALLGGGALGGALGVKERTNVKI